MLLIYLKERKRKRKDLSNSLEKVCLNETECGVGIILCGVETLDSSK